MTIEVDGRTALALPRLRYARTTTGPLRGVRVLDLTRLVSGAQLGVVLGDLGADVIKVERPGSGDPFRHAGGSDAHWRAYARNKRSITLDLACPRGRELLLELAARADVLVENFAPGVLERLVGGPKALLERNPKLVVVRISGWGQTGPRSSNPGFGTLAEAFAGFTFLNGPPGGPPHPAPLSLADTVAGTYAALAALAALWEVRANGGDGQVVDVSLFEPLFSIMGADATAYAMSGRRRRRGDTPGISSVRGVFETADGHWVALSAATDETALRFFTALGRLDLLDDPRFATAAARHDNRDALGEVLAEEFAARTRDEVLRLAEEHRLTIGPVYDILDIIEDEHYRARKTVVEMEDGTVLTNVVPRLSRTPGAIRTPAPALGEHNAEVYGELGLDLEELEREGVI
ncbi:MAG TPA: CoA transferase [Gaiellaceae bacterium]|nr:CoA transferase [Gaiellaceae bacterium]